LGFKARALLARVHLTGIPSGRGHQIALVSIDGREIKTLPDSPAYLDALKTYFSIELDASYIDLKPLHREE